MDEPSINVLPVVGNLKLVGKRSKGDRKMALHGLNPWLSAALRYIEPLLVRARAAFSALAIIASPSTGGLLGGEGPQNVPCHPPHIPPPLDTDAGRRSPQRHAEARFRQGPLAMTPPRCCNT